MEDRVYWMTVLISGSSRIVFKKELAWEIFVGKRWSKLPGLIGLVDENVLMKCSMMEIWMAEGSPIHLPRSIFKVSNELLLLMVIERWKNLVLRSVMVSQVNLDFYFHSFSSLFRISLRFSWISTSRFLCRESSGGDWILMRVSFRNWIPNWIWPEEFLFQTFMARLVAFSFL